jgi:hypothetical protein
LIIKKKVLEVLALGKPSESMGKIDLEHLILFSVKIEDRRVAFYNDPRQQVHECWDCHSEHLMSCVEDEYLGTE